MLTFAVGLGVLFLRRPETILNAEFAFEDGREWYLDAWREGPAAVLQPYAGYLYLIPRLVAALERLLPVGQAPLVGNASAMAITASVAAFVSSDSLKGALPSQRVRITLAGVVILAPLSAMSMGSITFTQFWLAIFIVAAAFSSGGIAVRIVLVAAGLTGAFSILLVALFALRVWVKHDRESRVLLGVVGTTAIIQLLVLVANGRPSAVATTDPITVVGFSASTWMPWCWANGGLVYSLMRGRHLLWQSR